MANGEGMTGKIATLAFGETKKAKVTRHAASGTGGALVVVLLLNQFPGMLPYVMADSDYVRVRDTVTTIQSEMRSVTKEVSEFKSEYRQDARETQTLLRQVLTSQGVVPVVPEKKEPMTVVVYYNDTTGRGVYTHGDTAFVPMPSDTLPATRPR